MVHPTSTLSTLFYYDHIYGQGINNLCSWGFLRGKEGKHFGYTCSDIDVSQTVWYTGIYVRRTILNTYIQHMYSPHCTWKNGVVQLWPARQARTELLSLVHPRMMVIVRFFFIMVIVWLPLGKLSLLVERFCYTFMYKLSPEHRFASFVASSVLFQISFLITQMSRLSYAHVDYSWGHNRASHLQRAQLNLEQSSVYWPQKEFLTCEILNPIP